MQVKGIYGSGGNTMEYVPNKELKEKLDKIKVQIENLSDTLEETSAYSPFITFKVGKGVSEDDENKKRTMQFDTLSGLGKNGDVNNDSHYILQAEVKKIGLNSGNAFKIRIAFVADYTNDVYGSGDDKKEYLSLLDKIEHNNKVFDKFDESILFNNCELRYGYTFPVGGTIRYQLGPTYRGIVTNYSMEILNGYVMYELECVSGMCKLNEVTIDDSIVPDTKALMSLAGGSPNPIKLCVGLLRKYIEANNLNYNVINNVDIAVAEDGNGNKDDYVVFNDDNMPNGKHIMEYINEVLSKTRAKGQWNCYKATEYTEDEIKEGEEKGYTYIGDEEFITFFFTIEDDVENGEKPRIIFDYKPRKNRYGKDDDSDLINFDFEWLKGDKKGLIINFLPEFNGALYLANMGGLITNINTAMGKIYGARYYSYLIDNYGGVERVETETQTGNNVLEYAKTHPGRSIEAGLANITPTGNLLTEEETANRAYDIQTKGITYNSAGFVSSASMDKIIELFGTSEGLQNSIVKAKLQIVGIPASIPLTTKIKIIPIVNNKVHFSKGEYIITSMSDSISQAGFITSFDLMKNPTDHFRDILTAFLDSEYSGKFKKDEIDWYFNDGTNYDYFKDVYEPTQYGDFDRDLIVEE